MTHYAGIDWGDGQHFWAVVNDAGTVVGTGKVKNTADGFYELVEEITNLADPDTGEMPAVAIESERGLISAALREHGFPVYVISPMATRGLRSVAGMSVDKSDRRDAIAVANAIRVTPPGHLRLMTGVSPEAQAMRLVARNHVRAGRRTMRAAAALRGHTREYFPSLVDQFDSTELRKMKWVQDILAVYPTPGEFANAPHEHLAKIMKEGGRKRRIDWSINKFVAPIQQGSVLRFPPALEEQYGRITVSLVNQLQGAITVEEALYDELMAQYDAHPLADFFRSLPGVGEEGAVTGPRLLAEIGDDPTRFPRPDSLQAYAGARPQNYSSGKSVSVQMRKSRNLYLQNALHVWAANLARVRKGNTGGGESEKTGREPYSPASAWIIHRATEQGKTYNTGIRLVSKRLCSGLWYCLTYPTLYPESGLPWAEFDERIAFATTYKRMGRLGIDPSSIEAIADGDLALD